MSGADTRLLVQWTTTVTSETLVCITVKSHGIQQRFFQNHFIANGTAKIRPYFDVANFSHSFFLLFAHFFPLFALTPSAYSPKCPENDHPPPFPNGPPAPFG